MFSLVTKTAFVTGAASGIGRAIAECFASAGAFVYCADMNPEGAAIAASIGGAFISLDVSDEAAYNAAAQRVLAEKGRLDILANVAGIGHVGTVLDTAAADIERLHRVNVLGVFNGCKAFAPSMIEAGGGAIVSLASVGGLIGIPDRLSYCMSKFAVVGLTKAMALDHARSGLRVNCICPGRVETPFVKSRLAEYPDPAAAYAQMSASQPNGRMGHPEEIAAAARYLVSDEASFVTGEALAIDGGWHAG